MWVLWSDRTRSFLRDPSTMCKDRATPINEELSAYAQRGGGSGGTYYIDASQSAIACGALEGCLADGTSPFASGALVAMHNGSGSTVMLTAPPPTVNGTRQGGTDAANAATWRVTPSPLAHGYTPSLDRRVEVDSTEAVYFEAFDLPGQVLTAWEGSGQVELLIHAHAHPCSCACTCSCVHMRAHACTCVRMRTHAYTCVYMHAHACTCMYMCVHACTCSRSVAYPCTCMHMHAHTCTCTHMHTLGRWSCACSRSVAHIQPATCPESRPTNSSRLRPTQATLSSPTNAGICSQARRLGVSSSRVHMSQARCLPSRQPRRRLLLRRQLSSRPLHCCTLVRLHLEAHASRSSTATPPRPPRSLSSRYPLPSILRWRCGRRRPRHRLTVILPTSLGRALASGAFCCYRSMRLSMSGTRSTSAGCRQHQER